MGPVLHALHDLDVQLIFSVCEITTQYANRITRIWEQRNGTRSTIQTVGRLFE